MFYHPAVPAQIESFAPLCSESSGETSSQKWAGSTSNVDSFWSALVVPGSGARPKQTAHITSSKCQLPDLSGLVSGQLLLFWQASCRLSYNRNEIEALLPFLG